MGHDRYDREEQTQGSSDKTFGLVFSLIFGILGFAPLVHGKSPRLWALGVAAAFLGPALFIPSVLSQLNRLWTRLGMWLHKVMSPILLGVVFFGVITPMGAIMRWLGRDALRLRFDKDATDYWIERRPPGPAPDTYRNQF